MAKMWGKPKRNRGRLAVGRLWLLLLPLAGLLALAEWRLAPALESVARQQGHELAFVAISEAIATQSQLAGMDGDYQRLMHIEYDDQGRVTLLVPDTMALNQLSANVSLDVTERLHVLAEQDLRLPLGQATGSRLLADLGPNIRCGFRAHGAPQVLLEDDFVSAGINQVRHRLYLRVSSEIRVYVPFYRGTETVSVTMLLAESIIVGYTPEAYFNLQGHY